MLKEFKEKLRLMKRIKTCSKINELRLLLHLVKFRLEKRNAKIDMIVDIDDIKYKLVDLESLFIVSPRYEDWIWKYFTPKRGEVFVDVGAHIGKYTLRIAKIVGENGRVIAIEPDPENFKALLLGIKMNELKNVSALNIAAWDKSAILPLYKSKPDSKISSVGLHGKGWSSIKRKISEKIVYVVAKPLDKIIKELNVFRVDWIKIDAEGSEYEVLRGSKKTIEYYNPKIIIESLIKQTEIIEFMQKLGYSFVPIAKNHIFFQPAEKIV